MASDTVLQAEGVKALATEKVFEHRYVQALETAQRCFNAFFLSRGLFGMLLSVILITGFGGALLLGLQHVWAGGLTVGAFVLLNSYLLQLIRPVEGVSFSYRDSRQSLTALKRLLDLFELQPESKAGREAISQGQISVSFEHVDFSYGAKPILQDTSFILPPSTITLLMGPSGAGKSTIVRLILRFFEPKQGRVCFNGTDLTQLSANEVRRIVSVVPQDAVMFNDTLRFNITLDVEDGPDWLDIVIRRCALHSLVQRLPRGLDTQVGERGFKLSGGERQRIAIARAIYRRPRILLLDEATSSLDRVTEESVLMTIRSIGKDYTTLLISHDERLRTIADRTLVLDQGGVHASEAGARKRNGPTLQVG